MSIAFLSTPHQRITTVAMTEDEARATLRSAICIKDEAESDLAMASQAVERAKSRIADLTGKMEEYKSVESDIMAHSVQQIRTDV
jgi:hypothetical protein